VFEWTQESSYYNGNLFCALDAFERWLTLQLDGGADITGHIEQIFRESSSTAFLGLLVNVGKYRPALFSGALAPLLSEPYLFYWDGERVKNVGQNFIGWAWLQSGEAIFEIAKAWTLAPHRQRTLLDVTAELLKTDANIAKELKALIPSWPLPNDPKEALEFRLMFAALDRDNYQPAIDPESATEVLTLTYPEDLLRQVQLWRELHAKPLQYLLLPARCEELLQSQQTVSDESAAQLYDLLRSCDADEGIELDVKRTCKLALAATLIVSGDAWLSERPEAKDLATSIVKEAIFEGGATAEAIRNSRTRSSRDELKFAAYAAMHIWMRREAESREWQGLVLRLLTSGDYSAASTIFGLAYAYRRTLGAAFWRFLQAGVLWSGLVPLSPQHGDHEDVERAWNLWLARLRRFPLRRDGASLDDLKVARIAEGSEHLLFDRRLRAYTSGDRQWRGKPIRRLGMGLDTHFLGIVFGWLINGPGTADWAEDSRLAGTLWAYEADRARARAKETGEYGLPSQVFGYDILAKLAALSLVAPGGEARVVWKPVLSQGPEAHYAVQHFVRNLFLQLSKGHHTEKFEGILRETVGYALAAGWDKKRYWFYGERILCDLLGFGNEEALRRLPSGAALRMRDIYEQWANRHLARDEECITRFATFLTTEFGSPLRLDGLRWIAATLKISADAGSWYRKSTGDALIELLDASLNQNARELSSKGDARQALVEIAANLAARNIPIALALQERIKLLR
jgi:hypothetical protein